MEFEHVAEAIELPDNSGRQRVTFRPRHLSADSFVAEVTFTSESVQGLPDSELTLPDVPLSRDQFARLDEFLTKWLMDRSPFHVCLAKGRWAGFDVTVGPHPGYISSEDKPAFLIDVDCCGIASVRALIVDQTCMRLFHEGVAGWLHLARSTAS